MGWGETSAEDHFFLSPKGPPRGWSLPFLSRAGCLTAPISEWRFLRPRGSPSASESEAHVSRASGKEVRAAPVLCPGAFAAGRGGFRSLFPSLIIYSLLGWISRNPLEGVGTERGSVEGGGGGSEEGTLGDVEGSPGRQRGFAAEEGPLSFVLGSGARPLPAGIALLLSASFSPGPQSPSDESIFFFSAIDEARGEGAYYVSVSFVSCNTFFSLWRFYDNHENATPNAAPTEMD